MHGTGWGGWMDFKRICPKKRHMILPSVPSMKERCHWTGNITSISLISKDKEDTPSYQPVFFTSVLRKLWEEIIRKRWHKFLKKNEVMSSRQYEYGFSG